MNKETKKYRRTPIPKDKLFPIKKKSTKKCKIKTSYPSIPNSIPKCDFPWVTVISVSAFLFITMVSSVIAATIIVNG